MSAASTCIGAANGDTISAHSSAEPHTAGTMFTPRLRRISTITSDIKRRHAERQQVAQEAALGHRRRRP